MRTSPSRGSQPVPLGQPVYTVRKERVRLSDAAVVVSWATEVPHQPVGEQVLVGGTTWQFLAEKLDDSIRLHAARLKSETGELLSVTALPLSPRTTLEEAQALSDSELGVVPTFTDGTFGNDFENGDGLLEHGGYLCGFLVWREEPESLDGSAYVIPRQSNSPQLICVKLTEDAASVEWTLAGDASLPSEYRLYSSVVLDPRPGTARLMVYWEGWAWQSASNLFTDHVPDGDGKNYLCGFRDYETALPILPGAQCQPEDTADYDGWVRDEGDTSYLAGHQQEYLDAIDNTRDHFIANEGPGYWANINTAKAPRWHRHGYRVVDPRSGSQLLERPVKILSGEAAVRGGALTVVSARSEWVPPETDPHDVASAHGFVVQKPGDGVYDNEVKRGYIDQVDPATESLYLFKEFIVWSGSVNPADDPESLTWFVNYGVSSPSLYALDVNRYSHWTFGAPSLNGNPQNFSTADTGITFPWRFWAGLLMKTGLTKWTQDASYRVPWHTCDAVCSGDRVIFRARQWNGGNWPEPGDDFDGALETGLDQIAAADGSRPASYPLMVLDWDLTFNPDGAGASSQSSDYRDNAALQRQYSGGDTSARTRSNGMVHGQAPAESGAGKPLTWWLERVVNIETTGGEVIVDENGDPVLDENGDPQFEPEVEVTDAHCQVWVSASGQDLRLQFSELTTTESPAPVPGDVSGTAQQDVMVYQLTDVQATGLSEVDGQLVETYPLKSLVVVAEEGFVGFRSPAGAIWVGLMDNPGSTTRTVEE